MGHKINPNAIRIGVNKGWSSVWYANKRDFSGELGLDLKLKDAVRKALNMSGLDSVKIYKYSNRVDIEALVARPGVAIGRAGAGIDELQKKLKKIAKMDVEVKIKEVKKPDISARVIARNIADGIERRQPSKLLIAAAKEKAMMAGATGIKIQVGGRINNASQARKQKDGAGPVPRQTLRANIDYALEVAQTADAGLYGVKVWVYKPQENTDETK
ncbi:30S ribosomal protein S3 [bacterium]|nr:30S ribosomal protein S3 [bacterium]